VGAFGWRLCSLVLTGASAAALTRILQAVQHYVWPGPPGTLLDAAFQATPWRHILVLLGAGLVTGAGQVVLVRLTSSNSIDITEAIWFSAGRLPALRTLGSAVLSVVVVGMGASLGREGAPKQAGAVIANVLSDKASLSDEQRRLLVACGAGAGMAAAYGVPLGGALFALEVLRGMLALRLVLAALLTSVIATAPLGWRCQMRRLTSSLTSTARLLIWLWRFSLDPSPVSSQLRSFDRSRGPIETGRRAGSDWWLPCWRSDCSGWYPFRFHNCLEMAKTSPNSLSVTKFRSRFC
jgi:hypothetical protein